MRGTTTSEEKIGKMTMRWQRTKDGGFAGAIIQDRKIGEILHDEDEDRLKARLRNLAGTLHPDYFGIDGAIARFLKFMPGGFAGERNLVEERNYKVAAAQALAAALPLASAVDAGPAEAQAVLKTRVWTNLLSPFEQMRLREVLGGPDGGPFLSAAARFALGDHGSGIAGMTKSIEPYGRLSWPMATYLPYLWDAAKCMFLKPEVTLDYAIRVGHGFQHAYKAAVEPEVYSSLLDLADFTRRHIAPLAPRDLIDVQSFIWVVGAYRDGDLPA